MAEAGFGVCDRRGNVRGMTFDEEMKVPGTMELELKRGLTCLQKVPVPRHPPRDEITRVNERKRFKHYNVLERGIDVAGFQRSNDPM